MNKWNPLYHYKKAFFVLCFAKSKEHPRDEQTFSSYLFTTILLITNWTCIVFLFRYWDINFYDFKNMHSIKGVLILSSPFLILNYYLLYKESSYRKILNDYYDEIEHGAKKSYWPFWGYFIFTILFLIICITPYLYKIGEIDRLLRFLEEIKIPNPLFPRL